MNTLHVQAQKRSPVDMLKMKHGNFEIVDFKFVDLLGKWQHFSIPTQQLNDDIFSEGIGFDGSSIRGFQSIEKSDMLLLPDSESAFIDVFSSPRTLSLSCTVAYPSTLKAYDRDPRSIALKAENYLRETGIATHSYWGPEVEFFILDSARFDQQANTGFYVLDSDEGIWNRGIESNGVLNRGYRPRHKEGYFPVAPVDRQQNIRNEMTLALQAAGIEVERQHHEVATAGQAEIDIKYDTLVRQADNILKFKYVVSNVAHNAGKVVTFMPKPLFGDNGSGMHTHQSVWKNEKNLFYDEKESYANLSQIARYYIGGLFDHAHALMAILAPTTNSYKRLVPGFEAPVNLVYSKSNRSAAVRIPMYSGSVAAKRIEFRSPDPLCNPYLGFSAMLLAGLDGIHRKIEPNEPLDEDTYHLSAEKKARIKSVPGRFEDALNALESDHAFLLKGNVFSSDVIQTWLDIKRAECDQVRLRPHPWEFVQHFDS
ncbi:MAG TPA: type I glutamate--ammonia ligase [Candidatus Nanoarchaeia archaeon]|nr:type I glutamate--ammonia ligase [Candidatus Nanoarchaeia archaeon]